MAVTADSASNNSTFMTHLVQECQGRDLWHITAKSKLNCFAHVMNLAAQDFLKSVVSSQKNDVTEIDEGEPVDDPLIEVVGNNNIVNKVKINCRMYLF